jgi:integrase
MRDFVLLALLTGARRANVLAMRLQDVNLDRGEWRIPETKRGESQTVTLVPEAVEILRRRSAKFTGGEFVLPAKSKVGHLREPKSGWRHILKRSGISDVLNRPIEIAHEGGRLCPPGRRLSHQRRNASEMPAAGADQVSTAQAGGRTRLVSALLPMRDRQGSSPSGPRRR